MKSNPGEQGQALILIVFGLIVLIGITGLAVDGGMAYENRRQAQNAADAAALAGALAYGRQQDVNSSVFGSALTNGFNNDGTDNQVRLNIQDSPAGACEGGAPGQDITVQITSHAKTYFAPVIGITQITNTVAATTRLCGTYIAPLFDGNAIVALSPAGTDFDGSGNPHWDIEGGGIFVNSSSSSAAICKGAASILAPSVTAVGGTNFACSPAPAESTITTGASPYSWADYENKMPPLKPSDCTGTATLISGTWYPQYGAIGNKVSLNGDMNFSPGIYCVTNSPGPYHGYITGSGVTFYVLPANFSIKFNGSGNGFVATAPTSGPLAGVLMYVQPQVDAGGNLLHTQSIDLRGNGYANMTGTILAPSADVTMYGNSGTAGDDTQIVAYQVLSGGGANIKIRYNAADNWQPTQDMRISFIK